MNFYAKNADYALNVLNTNAKNGLSSKNLTLNVQKYGYNRLTQKKDKSVLSRIADALKEPMLIILLFGFAITLGASIGEYVKSGHADFVESLGILGAVVLSVSITVIMESSSQKAFFALNKIYQNVVVSVIRDGQRIVIDRNLITVGDIVFLESGDKIVADGRLIQSDWLSVDESALTGESLPVKKDANIVLSERTVLAERINCVYSGTFVTAGSGKMVVTAVGDKTEMGLIAGEISDKNALTTPLQNKLTKLGKIVTLIGAICAVAIFAISLIRLLLSGNFTFNSLSDLFISCIILIVAAVPEGLPTIVAVSLALNMIKLAKENALIKKMSATETAGAISVICSDKTGTLTENKMSVLKVCTSEFCASLKKKLNGVLEQNFICNSTADVVGKSNNRKLVGSGTETALLQVCINQSSHTRIEELRQTLPIVHRIPFSSNAKFMTSVVKFGDKYRILTKGAPEKVLEFCDLTKEQKAKIMQSIQSFANNSQRIICFAHKDVNAFSESNLNQGLVYDGLVTLADPIRQDVKKAVNDCKRAGVKVKILTGDNLSTAYAIAKELGLAKNESSVINASFIENMTDEQLREVLPRITVIARSTPIIKLRVVRVLKQLGEVVAVTGDGINDAPAIKHADVGFAMGVSGSDITKETADVVLLDDSFSTVVKAISFGRNVYKNLQRFIVFQLSVNLSALLFITVCALLGLPAPFNTLQLLWINVIMDGPPALTLGLESASKNLMKQKPVKRTDGIVTGKMLIRIIFNGLFISAVMVCEYITGFIGGGLSERKGIIFSLFVLFQLFNAFNCRELGAESIFKSVGKNKVMVWTFALVFVLHVFIVQVGYSLFGIAPISLISWLKCIGVATTIIIISEAYKLLYRLLRCKH